MVEGGSAGIRWTTRGWLGITALGQAGASVSASAKACFYDWFAAPRKGAPRAARTPKEGRRRRTEMETPCMSREVMRAPA